MSTKLTPQKKPSRIDRLISKFNITRDQAQNILDWLKDEDEIDASLEVSLYSFYMDNGEMPFEVAKAKTADPYEWLYEKLKRELNL